MLFSLPYTHTHIHVHKRVFLLLFSLVSGAWKGRAPGYADATSAFDVASATLMAHTRICLLAVLVALTLPNILAARSLVVLDESVVPERYQRFWNEVQSEQHTQVAA